MKSVVAHLRLVVEIALICVAVLIWRDERAAREKAEQAETAGRAQIMAAQKDSARSAERLQQQLAALQAQKNLPATAHNLTEQLRALGAARLPVPLESSTAVNGDLVPLLPGAPAAQSAGAAGSIIVPAVDAPVLRDDLLACQAAEDRLSACSEQSKDVAVELAATQRERDAWHRAANGGSWLHRAVRAVEYVGIGVGVGYALAKR